MKIVFLVIAILIYIPNAYSQFQEFKFRHLTVKDGLPSNAINAIVKDDQGYMWFGTDNGLARYDGYDIMTYTIPKDSIFSANSQVINDIFEDSDGNLWVGTDECGLLPFDRISETFTSIIYKPGDSNNVSHYSVNVIYQDGNGTLWTGTNGGGLNSLDLKNSEYNVYKHFPQDNQNLNNNVTAILEDKNNNLWVGTQNGVFLFDRDSGYFSSIELPVQIPPGIWRIVNCIIEDKYNRIWIGTYWGLFRYNPDTKIITQISEHLNLSHGVITSIAEDTSHKSNRFWIATQYGLNRLHNRNENVQKFYQDHNDPRGLSSDIVSELFLDDFNQLWIGTFTKGVDILNTSSNPYHQYEVRNLKSDVIWQPISFCVDIRNELWVGALDGGLFHYDKGFNLISNYTLWEFDTKQYDRRHNDRISCIFEESESHLLLGFYEWGLIRFNKTDEAFKEIELLPNLNSPIRIDNILRDKSGVLWVGTNQGLYAGVNNNVNDPPLYAVDHELLSNAEILRIFEDKKGRLWVSTRNNGSFLMEKDSLKDASLIDSIINFRTNNFFPGDYIRTFYEDNDSVLWMGTNKGLNKYNPTDHCADPIDIFNDKYSGEIINIYGDDQDNLWIFHSIHGLLRFNKTDNRNNVKKYDTEDGLPFDQFNTKYFKTNSFYQSRDGRLFMGCDVGSREGFFWFHPDSVKDNKKTPAICLTDFKVGNQSFPLDSNINYKRNIILKNDENFFSFQFAALNYLIPEKNQYAYYLEGFEDDWIYSGNRRFAYYTGVPPGKYIFHVKGSNNDGYWNEEGTSVQITVLPPFWKTWWAYVIYGIILISMISSIIYYYLRRQRLLQKLAIEQVEAEKLKELDGLKTHFFTNISHEFRTPLTLILGPVQQLLLEISNRSERQRLSVIQQNAQRLKELVDQLLNLSKLESGKMALQATEVNLVQFVKSCIQSFESLAGHKKIDLSFSADQDAITIYIDKAKMTQVVNNLLSNAFKFTPDGGRISIEVGQLASWPVGQDGRIEKEKLSNCQLPNADLPAKCIIITISDTGKGIAPDHLAHIFDRFYQVDDSISREQEGTGIGLAIAQEMVKLHGGEIEVSSEVGVGTTFRIFLPMGDEHLMEEEKGRRGEEENDESRQSDPSDIENGDMKSSTIHPPPSTIHEGEKPLLLIVEDNPDMRAFIRGYFEDSYQVLEAENGEVGLKIAIEQIPDIVVSDVMMPKMDGYKFCQKLKTDEKTSHIPVILLTARATKESRMEGLESGADDFITKPFDGEELQVRVKNLVDQRKKLSEHYQRNFNLAGKKASEVPLSMDEKFLKKAQDLIEENLSNADYGVGNFATDMALSRVQLHRKLRALVDQSATGFIRSIRLNHAMILLQKKAGTIAEIAYDAGFNNPTYFTISFKKKFGITPTDYLDQLEKK